YDLEMQYNFAQRGRHEIVVGGNYRLLMDSQKNSPHTTFTPKDRNNHTVSFFAQDKITLQPETLFLTLGTKVEHNDYSGVEIQPTARLQWQPDESQTLWAAVSRAVRTATPLETNVMSTLGAGPGLQAALVGNPDFESEELIAYEVGYRRQITPALSVDTAAFYNDYDHLATLGLLPTRVVNDGVTPPYLLLPVEFQNDMTGRSYGLELSASWMVTPRLKLSANYSYMKLMLDALDNTALQQEGAEDLYPPHQFSIRAYWDITDRWSLNTTSYYVDELQGSNVDDYVRLDINLGYQISENVRFNLVGQNLLDDAHREFDAPTAINASEVGRSVYGKVTWEF
ncbi:MAG: TonB-dependent receptor, partial [Alphaproteobacteria bacterium]|nr:TonB-dependent receptor [Alphaproteobacteria bacterium]